MRLLPVLQVRQDLGQALLDSPSLAKDEPGTHPIDDTARSVGVRLHHSSAGVPQPHPIATALPFLASTDCAGDGGPTSPAAQPPGTASAVLARTGLGA